MPSNAASAIFYAGGVPIIGHIVVPNEHHIHITAGADREMLEWHIELADDRLRIKLALQRHIDYVRGSETI